MPGDTESDISGPELVFCQLLAVKLVTVGGSCANVERARQHGRKQRTAKPVGFVRTCRTPSRRRHAGRATLMRRGQPTKGTRGPQRTKQWSSGCSGLSEAEVAGPTRGCGGTGRQQTAPLVRSTRRARNPAALLTVIPTLPGFRGPPAAFRPPASATSLSRHRRVTHRGAGSTPFPCAPRGDLAGAADPGGRCGGTSGPPPSPP